MLGREIPRGLALAVVASLTAASWVTATLVMSGRGLDITDEGFYLLSYRWWDSNPYNFSGVQYLYGPVYEAIGYDVQELRVIRLFSILVVHLTLGIAAARWIRETSGARARDARDATVVLGVVAAGGIVFAWGPLSPGYNDVGLLASLLLGALALSLHRHATAGRSLPLAWAIAAGPIIIAFALAKWASALLVVPFVIVVVAVAVRHLDPRGVRAWWLGLFLSTAGSIVAVHVAIQPLPRIVEPLVTVGQHLSGSSNEPTALLALYASSTAQILAAAAVSVAAAMLLLAGAKRCSSDLREVSAITAPLVAAAISVAISGGLAGGVAGVWGYVVVLTSIAATTWLIGRRQTVPQHSPPGMRPVMLLLILLPGVQAAGTGNPLLFLAANGFPLWLVVLLRGWFQAGGAQVARRTATVGIAACLLVVAWVSVSGLVLNPYRTDPYATTDAEIESESTGSLLISTERATIYQSMQAAVPGGAPVMAFDEMAGIVLLLDGRSVGEPWYSAQDPERTAEGIAAYCRDSSAELWGTARPVILFNRPVTHRDVAALRSCGLSFYRDFREVTLPASPELRLWLPTQGGP